MWIQTPFFRLSSRHPGEVVMAFRDLRIPLIALGIVLAISAIFGMKGPLQDVHWDAPIYIARAKQFVETPYLRDYVSGAAEIAGGMSRWKIGEDIAYWGFVRLGNTILLGSVTSLVGANVASIYAGFWLYTVILAAALVTGVLLTFRLADAIGQDLLPSRVIILGAIVSAGLYLASDVYRYLSGNQVSEVPAMLLLTGAALALVEATRSRSIALGVVSGALGFALFVVRFEAVWAYLSFLLTFAGMLFLQHRERTWLHAMLAFGSTALLLYLCYAWLFWPLADPRLLVMLAAGVQEATQSGTSSVKLLVAAGGPLWVGLLLAVRFGPSNRMSWFALIWLVLLLVPHMDALLGRRQTELRMYAPILVPLLFGSTVGWGSAVDRAAKGKVGRAVIPLMAILVVAIITVSQSETYQLLRQLPGGWRLQYAREWLSPPSYERLSYAVDELGQLSQFVYGRREATVLVPDEGKLEENLRIIWYLAPAQSQVARGKDDPAATLLCQKRILRPRIEHVMFCTERPMSRTIGDPEPEIEVLYLRQRNDPTGSADRQGEKTVFQTTGFELVSRAAH